MARFDVYRYDGAETPYVVVVQRIFLQWEEASLRRVREIQRLLGDQPLDEVICQ